MPTFNIALRGGGHTEIKYSPLIYTRMTSIYKFALHKSGRNYVVSDIGSGAKICTVTGWYKGCPVASGTLPLKTVRQLAIADIDALVDRIGFDKFHSVISNPRPF